MYLEHILIPIICKKNYEAGFSHCVNYSELASANMSTLHLL